MITIALILALFFLNIFLIWYLFDTIKFCKEKEKKLLKYIEQKDNEKKKVFEAATKAVGYCLQYNQKCIESHERTLQALQSKYVKAIDLAIERGKLHERGRRRLEKKWQELKNEILKEMETAKVSEKTARKLLKEAEQKKDTLIELPPQFKVEGIDDFLDDIEQTKF